MIVVASLIRYLSSLGLTGAQIADAIEASTINDFQLPPPISAQDRKREKDRERIATKRDKARQSATVADIVPSDKEVSPTPPSRNYLPLPSEPNGSSGDMTRVREAKSGFDGFWKAFPRRENKKGARVAYDKAETRLFAAGVHDPPGFILEAVIRFQPVWEAGLIPPHPTTWLNGDRWDDEIPIRGVIPNGRNTTPPVDRGAAQHAARIEAMVGGARQAIDRRNRQRWGAEENRAEPELAIRSLPHPAEP